MIHELLCPLGHIFEIWGCFYLLVPHLTSKSSSICKVRMCFICGMLEAQVPFCIYFILPIHKANYQDLYDPVPAGSVAAVVKPQVISFLFFIVAKIFMVPLGLRAVQRGSLGLMCQVIHHQKQSKSSLKWLEIDFCNW